MTPIYLAGPESIGLQDNCREPVERVADYISSGGNRDIKSGRYCVNRCHSLSHRRIGIAVPLSGLLNPQGVHAIFQHTAAIPNMVAACVCT